jgi:hypothetical protein
MRTRPDNSSLKNGHEPPPHNCSHTPTHARHAARPGCERKQNPSHPPDREARQAGLQVRNDERWAQPVKESGALISQGRAAAKLINKRPAQIDPSSPQIKIPQPKPRASHCTCSSALAAGSSADEPP